jgi:hypothetical protein
MLPSFHDLKVNADYKLSEFVSEAQKANLIKKTKVGKAGVRQKFGQFLIQIGNKLLAKSTVPSSEVN